MTFETYHQPSTVQYSNNLITILMFEAAGAGDPGAALGHARLAAGVPGDQVRAAGTHSQGLLPSHQDRPGQVQR